MRALIVDDDAVYHSLLTPLLDDCGFEAIHANNGAEAICRLEQEPDIRVMIADWLMPVMDGYQLCRAIRQELGRDDIQILIMTGSARKEDLMQVIVAGADDYLIKPFDPLDLKIHLRTAQRLIELQDEVARLRRGHAMQE